jgi:hypothetical protein
MSAELDKTIGYSGLSLFEECYEYHENACLIADTRESANELMQAYHSRRDCRIEPVTLPMIMKDYGCSCGEYAMGGAAFARFKASATGAGIAFDSHIEQCDFPLVIVRVKGVKLSDDE